MTIYMILCQILETIWVCMMSTCRIPWVCPDCCKTRQISECWHPGEMSPSLPTLWWVGPNSGEGEENFKIFLYVILGLIAMNQPICCHWPIDIHLTNFDPTMKLARLQLTGNRLSINGANITILLSPSINILFTSTTYRLLQGSLVF